MDISWRFKSMVSGLAHDPQSYVWGTASATAPGSEYRRMRNKAYTLFFDDVGSDLDRNAAAHARCCGTLLFVGRDGSLGRFALSRRNAHIVVDADLRDAEYAVDRFDVAFDPRSNLVRL